MIKGDRWHKTEPAALFSFSLMGSALVLGFFLHGEWGAFFRASQEGALMAIIGVLAYMGSESRVARLSAWTLLGGLLTFLAACNVVVAAEINGCLAKGTPPHALSPGVITLLGCVATASFLSALTAIVPLFKGSRSLCTAVTGNSEWTGVRVTALGGVTSITLLLFVPICALGGAPMLVLLQHDGDLSRRLIGGMGNVLSQLRGEMYDLCWSLLASMLAVGLGFRRNCRECLERLGLVSLSPRLVGAALGLTALVCGLSEGIDLATGHIWGFFGWPETDEKSYEVMFKAFGSPIGALVVGFSAGFGEEVLVRGMLQPRLGILLSTLFFTALHAYQYNWDGLIGVFIFGLMLGLIRKRTSTSVCAVVHGGFDFILVMRGLLPT